MHNHTPTALLDDAPATRAPAKAVLEVRAHPGLVVVAGNLIVAAKVSHVIAASNRQYLTQVVFDHGQVLSTVASLSTLTEALQVALAGGTGVWRNGIRADGDPGEPCKLGESRFAGQA